METRMQKTVATLAAGFLVILGVSLALTSAVSAGRRADRPGRAARQPEMQTQPGGGPPQVVPQGTVHDDVFKVTWLTDANLAASEKFGVSNINKSGSMDYQTALKWVKAMNDRHYLGHTDWTLPTSPAIDTSCNSRKDNYFGYGCKLSAMASLYTNALHLSWPRAVVAISGDRVGPFKNFQPNLYWTAEAGDKNKNGYGTFSFNNGAQGSNVDQNYFYVLPMVPPKQLCPPAGAKSALQLSADGKTVYDPVTCVTWAADANLAASEKFGIPAVNVFTGAVNISPTGGMTHAVALAWVAQMKASGYGGQHDWVLPPLPKPKASGQCGSTNPIAGCDGNPLGELYYNQLHLREGELVTPVPNVKIGAFHNFQPYLYWSCNGDAGQNTCSTTKPLPEAKYGWSFNFGDGFQGTDQQPKNLYVIVYYPDPAPPPPHPPRPPTCRPGVHCQQ